MSDFVPEDMLQLIVEAGEETTLHEDAPADPIFIRGAYFTNAPPTVARADRLVDFFILDPNYKVVYSRRRHEEGIFRFNTTMKGQYSFVFSNMKDKINPKAVTIAIHPGYDQDQLDDKILQGENTEMAKAAGI